MPHWLILLLSPFLAFSPAFAPAPTIVVPASCPINQYAASYYNNLTYAGKPVLTRCEYSVGAAWGKNSPAPGVQAGNFSVIYTGSVNFPSGGVYNWNANTIDVAVRVSVDGVALIDQRNPTWGNYLVSAAVKPGVHTVQVAVFNAATDGEESFSVSPAMSGNSASLNGNYFAQNSFYNQRIPARVTVDPRSSSWVNMIYNDPIINQIVINNNAWTVPIYKAPAGTPTVSVAITNWNNRITIPYLPSFRPSPDIDAHLAVIDTTNGCEYEFQDFNPTTMTAHASSTYHVYTGSGAHVADQEHSGGELSYIGGVITPQDVRAGVITHALRFAIPDNTWTFTYPGTRSDGTTPGGVPEGTLMQLDPSLNLNALNLTPFQRMVARALQTYGAYDSDTGGAFALYAESITDGSTYSQPLDPLPKSLIRSLRFLAPQASSTALALDSRNDAICQQPH